MSDIKQALSAQSSAITVTNLNSLASSATAGWRSAAVDNTSNLYLDIEVEITLDFANTAPANGKAVYVYAYAGDGSVYETTGAATGGAPDGTEGTLTFPDITANATGMRLAGVIPYVVADVPQTRFIRLAQAFSGGIPAKWGIALVNYTGAALAASGNNIYWRGVYATVA